uniref:Uncharacterized protein n=1 Tax=Lactuca sativa TaxID=4236 RepID=A0A9R1W189_LACSA|nr:hypothetical protein LSAT_V11C400177890 [Lactuca sativa]
MRLWKQTTWSKPHETRQIGMILMDEEGNKIECTVEKPYVILGKALEEYTDVYIHKPTLGLYVDDALKRQQVFATLWGDYVEQVDSYVSKHRVNFVMIIQCARWKDYRGLMKKKVDRLLHVLVLQRLLSCILGVMPSFLEQLRCFKIINNGTTRLARTIRERFIKCPLNRPMFWMMWLRMNLRNMSETVAFPVEINELIGRKMAFKIIVRGFTSGRKYIRSYNISKISDDVDIIFALEQLEKANHIEQDTETESVNVVVSDFNSQDTIGCKGSASFVADNTPISTFPNTISMSQSTNHDTTSLLSPTTNVKCKLVDVYDLEDTVCESSTKSSKKSSGIKETIMSTQLLIPKVEK